MEGGEVVVERAMVAWKTAWLTLTASCSSSTEYFWPSAFGRSVASFTSASFKGRQSPRGSRKVSVSFRIALEECFLTGRADPGVAACTLSTLCFGLYLATFSMLPVSSLTLPSVQEQNCQRAHFLIIVENTRMMSETSLQASKLC